MSRLEMNGMPKETPRAREPVAGKSKPPSLAHCGEPLVGLEPTTARLRIECSTTELQWPINNAGAHAGAPPIPCPGADSNRDAFRHYPLKIAWQGKRVENSLQGLHFHT